MMIDAIGRNEIEAALPEGITFEPAEDNHERYCRLQYFPTWWDLVEFLRCTPTVDGRRQEGYYGDRTDWNGNTQSMNEALDLASSGWKMNNEFMGLLDEIESSIGHRYSFDAVQYAATGAVPDVGLFLSGEPECMMDFAAVKRPGGRQHVHVILDTAASACVSGQAIVRRGAAIIALADVLERNGIGVEIDVLETTSYNGYAKIMGCSLKRVGQPIDPDLFNYALCHAAVPRRMFFGVRDHDLGPKGVKWAGLGYGSVCVKKNFFLNADLVFINSDNTSGRFASAATTAQWVIECAEKFLIDEDSLVL